MAFLDKYIFLLMIFSPLVAAFFITLIPPTDTGSKLAISKFFAVIGFAAYVRVFMIYLGHELEPQTTLSFSVVTFNISLTLLITKYNLFLYGAASAALLASIFLYDVPNTKTNIHQVAPFLLTFFLYVSFGQADLRVALPILSIANFLLYFLIGFADQVRRGATIFQMGIFLFATDGLALVLLQIVFSDHASPTAAALINALLLVPGLTRLGLPIFAPFMKRLLLNMDDREGSFIMVFLQLSGLFTLIMAKNNLAETPQSIVVLIAGTALVGAIYLALLFLTEPRIKAVPYYYLLFYSSLVSVSLFLPTSDVLWPYSVTLFLTNITCFFPNTFIATSIGKSLAKEGPAHYAPIWLVAQCLFLGLPGLGIGSCLWALFYRVASLGIFDQSEPLRFWWLTFSMGWLIGLFLLACNAIANVRELWRTQPASNTGETRLPYRRSLLAGPTIAAIFSLMLPFIVYYARLRGI